MAKILTDTALKSLKHKDKLYKVSDGVYAKLWEHQSGGFLGEI